MTIIKKKIRRRKKSKPKKNCISGCGRVATVDSGFCGICHPRFLKGYFLSNGSKHHDVIVKERRLEISRAKRAKKKLEATVKEDMKIIRDLMSRDILKEIEEANPESKKLLM